MKKLLFITALCAITAFSAQNGVPQSKRKLSKPASEWKKTLTPDQYEIMVESGTEPPYKNAYWNNHQKGVYVSAATGDVLFSSDDKYDSHTGWPSFVKPIKPGLDEIKVDRSYGEV